MMSIGVLLQTGKLCKCEKIEIPIGEIKFSKHDFSKVKEK